MASDALDTGQDALDEALGWLWGRLPEITRAQLDELYRRGGQDFRDSVNLMWDALRGMDVTVVHLGEWIMERQLDEAAAGMLQASLEAKGMKFLLARDTEAALAAAEAGVAAMRGVPGVIMPGGSSSQTRTINECVFSIRFIASACRLPEGCICRPCPSWCPPIPVSRPHGYMLSGNMQSRGRRSLQRLKSVCRGVLRGGKWLEAGQDQPDGRSDAI